MGDRIIGLTLRLLVGACGCAAGAVCAYAAFSNGKLVDPGEAGPMFGVGFAAVVFFSWLMLPVASWCARLGAYGKAWTAKACWVLALVFVLANAIVFASSHRVETVEGRGLAMDGYADAKADKARAIAELDGMKRDELWAASSSCANATTKKERSFCANVQSAQGRIQAASDKIALGRPGAKDAGAETLAWVIGGDAAKVGRAWPVFIGVILELVACAALKFTLSPWAPKAKAATLETAPLKPAVQEQTPIDLTAAAKALAARPRKRRAPRLSRALLPPPSAGDEQAPPPRRRSRQTVKA